ncbi:MAG: caspase family protein, partial [Thiomargarita sp.]|nr:caspase family protein [Thiomargarita sp.]
MIRVCILLFSVSMMSSVSARLALIIGNGAYQHVQPLDNPVNDAKDMAKVLKKLGFEVIVKYNVTNQEMTEAVENFGTRLQRKGGVGLFYFSGHGIQNKGINYLVPIDAKIKKVKEIRWKNLDANYVLAQMERVDNGINIMILDACRDDPFKNNPNKKGFGGIKKGFAKMDSPTGALIAYATAPNTASYGDAKERNSYYTKYLMTAMQQYSHWSVLDMLTEVTKQVSLKTEQVQVPWSSTSLTERFCFGTCGVQSIIPEPIPPRRVDVSKLLKTCQRHFNASRLTSGRGGTAVACYSDVLKLDANNTQALDGLDAIEAKYVKWIQKAIRQHKKKKALRYMASLRIVNPDSPKLQAFEEKLDIAIPIMPQPIPQSKTVFRDRLKDGSKGPVMVW